MPMTKDHVIQIAHVYELRYFDHVPAVRNTKPKNGREVLLHLSWMHSHLLGFAEQGKLKKAERWIRFIQASVWTLARTTLEIINLDNKGDCEVL